MAIGPSAPPSVIEAAWGRLLTAAAAARGVRLARLFEAEPDRMERTVLDAGRLHLDFAKQAWTIEGLDAALALAKAAGVEAARDRMFAGDAINASERRAVLHTALRAPDGSTFAAVSRRWRPCAAGWPTSPRPCAQARFAAPPASRFARCCTSASAAPTSGRAWSGRR